MRVLSRAGVLVILSLSGCGRPPVPALQPGDTVVPEVALAIETHRSEGTTVAIGLLLQVERPGRSEMVYLRDGEVPVEQALMRARITFLKEDTPLGDPLEAPFVHDC